MEHPRHYDPYGRPVTGRVKASEQRSHSQIWSPRSARNQVLNHCDELLARKFVRDRHAKKVIRFVVRAGQVTRMP